MNHQQSFWYLENIDVTNLFCPQKVGAAHDSMIHKSFKKGEYVYLPGEMADKIFFVMEGRVKIGAFGESGKEVTKAILGKGEVFGELPLTGTDERHNFAQAMENTSTCVISVDQMKALLKDHSGLNLFFMKIMGNRMLEMEKRLESLVFKDSRTRVIEFIKELVSTKGQRVGYEWVVRKFLTHQEIANMTATSRQTVTTVLNELESKEILTYNRRRLLVRDLEKLTEEVEA